MYQAPIDVIGYTLKHIAGFGKILQSAPDLELDHSLAAAILEEAGRFAQEAIIPVVSADKSHTHYAEGAVTMPEGWPLLYRDWCDGGWNGLAAPTAFGGQGLPFTLSLASYEIWNAASMSFALAPILTNAAIAAIDCHGDAQIKERFLPSLISGKWSGTMNMTEPQSGSDLSGISTRAEPAGDQTYRISGQKIYITFGEHDLSENIIHLVLARMADAPSGTAGLSLFLVPKYLINADGSLGERNDIQCLGIEDKLGIHASPTCIMAYGMKGGANGYLLGNPGRGLAQMFTMMNIARLMVGIQGVGIAARAFSQAREFAASRRQGRARNGAIKDGGMSPINHHPDIRRMLADMEVKTQIARALCYLTAQAIDLSLSHQDEAVRDYWQRRAGILTPIAKAFASEIGVEVASLNIQIHGGAGYLEPTGAAQLWRDARIAPIYEGTNGIQAIDLTTRKLTEQDGLALSELIGGLRDIERECAARNQPSFGRIAARLGEAIDGLKQASEFLLAQQKRGDMEKALFGATPFLRLCGLTIGAGSLAQGALGISTQDKEYEDSSNPDQQKKIAERMRGLCDHFCASHLGESGVLCQGILTGGNILSSLNLSED